jgi:hypothetical protein
MKSMNKIKKSAGLIRMRAGSLLVYTLFTAIASSMASRASAQTFAEWFKQKSTQKKYLLQQIAALEVYADYLKTGYQVAGRGLGSISSYLHSENGLHSTFYQKLNTPSSLVKESPQVAEILTWQADILDKLNEIIVPDGFSKDEKNHLLQVRKAVLHVCDEQLNQLENVLTDGRLEMSDSERLAKITTIHQAMQENYRFASGFTEQVQAYTSQRRRENNNIRTEKEFYAIH